MADEKAYIQRLIDQGHALLTLPKGRGEEFVTAIEEYAKGLDALLGGSASSVFDVDAKVLLEKLLEVHASVLTKADSHKGDTGKFLGSLQERGRGLRAYVDPLPKRISVRKPREG